MAVTVDCDLRYLFGDARDQEARPTCLAFAASDTHAAVRSGWQPLSCEYAYYHALRHDGGRPDEGTTLEGMMTAIEKDGQPHEDGWPYLSELPDDLTQWRPPTDVGQLFWRASEKKPITDLYALLDGGTPAIVAMSISDAFYTPDHAGVIDSDEPPDPVRLHAVIAVGYGTDGSERLVLVRNSWGKFWGLDGYAWLAESYLIPRLIALASMKESI
jgi:hypothetical protein